MTWTLPNTTVGQNKDQANMEKECQIKLKWNQIPFKQEVFDEEQQQLLSEFMKKGDVYSIEQEYKSIFLPKAYGLVWFKIFSSSSKSKTFSRIKVLLLQSDFKRGKQRRYSKIKIVTKDLENWFKKNVLFTEKILFLNLILPKWKA